MGSRPCISYVCNTQENRKLPYSFPPPPPASNSGDSEGAHRARRWGRGPGAGGWQRGSRGCAGRGPRAGWGRGARGPGRGGGAAARGGAGSGGRGVTHAAAREAAAAAAAAAGTGTGARAASLRRSLARSLSPRSLASSLARLPPGCEAGLTQRAREERSAAEDAENFPQQPRLRRAGQGARPQGRGRPGLALPRGPRAGIP
ncbi:spidroin-1-like [Erinaceus europaeus]|uniref:Spidroin-1-like n=1 Tax=Erinaceus europaeus TaxID=9365 RepID=A0ABM3Y1M4_ERIEU|nr:spidroin-1-like [Erinaceus europaeus]